jgi:hypothetical protein
MTEKVNHTDFVTLDGIVEILWKMTFMPWPEDSRKCPFS